MTKKLDIDHPQGDGHFPELDGIICAFVAAGLRDAKKVIALLRTEESQEPWQVVNDLAIIHHFNSWYAVLSSREHAIEMMLRKDDGLVARVEDLIDWCDGFLFGFSAAVSEKPNELINEVISDMTAVTQIPVEELTDSDADETDFTTIEEHIKILIATVFEEYDADESDSANDQNNTKPH